MWDLIIKNMKRNNESLSNHHFIFIEEPIGIVWPEVVLWGESTWWPKACQMKFRRLSTGEIQVGTKFEMRVTAPFTKPWQAEVIRLIPDVVIERAFLDGMFIGKEYVLVEPRSNGTRVDYVMEFKLNGFLNQILWPIIFERLHNKNIQMILQALKEFCIKKGE